MSFWSCTKIALGFGNQKIYDTAMNKGGRVLAGLVRQDGIKALANPDTFVKTTKAIVRGGEVGAKVAAKEAATIGEEAVKVAGRTKFLGKLGNLIKMPIIGTILTVGFAAVNEVPKVYSAFKEGGIWEGLKQTAKSVTNTGGNLAGMTAGSVIGGTIGTALIPIPGVGTAIGSIIGGIAGSFVGSKVTQVVTGEDFKTKEEQMAEVQENYPEVADSSTYQPYQPRYTGEQMAAIQRADEIINNYQRMNYRV